MKKHALYFMPDISGFTNFVTHTEIEHSKHIIAELLEILIDSDIIGLKLVEIEGDALFMYTETMPSFSDLVEQSKEMLNSFAGHLNLYNTNRICNCGACSHAHDLKVKFVVHYGEISFIRVKDIVKPYGGDVIKIHRFLKNSIPSNQYLLISKETIDFYGEIMVDANFKEKTDEYDFGISHYFYKELTSEKKLNISKLVKPGFKPQINKLITIPKDADHVYKFISDFNVRTTWYKLVDKLEYDELRLNRVGTIHTCLSESNSFQVETLGDLNNDNGLIYGERTKDMKDLELYSYYLTVKPIDNSNSELSIEVFLEFEEIDNLKKKAIVDILRTAWEESIFHLKTEVLKDVS